MKKTAGSRAESSGSGSRSRIPALALSALLVIVFLSGYILMALEILAFRIIQINFGSAIYSTGAVLGVVLAAMTLGYWAGGSMSVKLNPTKIMATGLVISGLWILMLGGIPNPVGEILSLRENPQATSQPYFAPLWKTIPERVLDISGRSLERVSDNREMYNRKLEYRMRIDPLEGSLILFALPSFLLAMVSPCAIRALTKRVEESGRMSGSVFALGSLGSIAGVLVTSFWLIAVLGLGANLRVIGIVAVLLGIIVGNLKLDTKR